MKTPVSEACKLLIEECENTQSMSPLLEGTFHRKKDIEAACKVITKHPTKFATIFVNSPEEYQSMIAFEMWLHLREECARLISYILEATIPHGRKDHLYHVRVLITRITESETLSPLVHGLLSSLEHPSCDKATIHRIASFMKDPDNWR
jgi:hypothetical protein